MAWKALECGGDLRIPVVGFYHSHFPEAYVRTVQKFLGPIVMEAFMDFARRYVRNLYGRFERTFVPSPALADLLVVWGLDRTRVRHNDLGVDTDIFQPREGELNDVRGMYGIPTERKLLLYVGRLAQEKNTHTLFAAFRLLHQEAPGKFQLFVVGDGLQRKELERLKTEAVGSVSHLAYCNQSEDLAKIYRAADLFVHPGVQETFGLATLEAQACGTPVIGIRGSYMDRIIHNDQTMWAEANTPDALAEAIVQMNRAEHQIDRVTLHRRIARKYSWDQIFELLFAEYREIVESYRSRS
ncbi:MAG: glycosyltransferase [Acidobacteria bacterium]|nr:glycosyltransferase [Acidobacteriota bacterium]